MLAAERTRNVREHLCIGVDGAQCTGKTTLLNYLKRFYKGIFLYIPEASREIAPSFGVRRSSDWVDLLRDPERLRRFFDREEDWLTEQESKPANIIVDSSRLVIWAYREAFGIPRNLTFTLRGYNLILYCPPRDELVGDGFRFSERRAEVDLAYRAIAKARFKGPFVSLPDGPNRYSVATSAIDDTLRAAGILPNQRGTGRERRSFDFG